MGIALMNTINGALTKTTYSKLVKITGMSYDTLVSAKSKKNKIRVLNNCYIVDDYITSKEKKEYLQNFSPKIEVWREINLNDFGIPSGKQKYFVSDLGRVKTVYKNNKDKFLSQFTKHGKWLCVKIKTKEIYTHKLVSKYFIDPPLDKSMVVHHKDGNIYNNDCSNLSWINKKMLGKKTGSKARSISVIKIDNNTGEVLDYYESMAEAGRENYLHKETIRLAVIGKLKTAGGFKWAVDNEILA